MWYVRLCIAFVVIQSVYSYIEYDLTHWDLVLQDQQAIT